MSTMAATRAKTMSDQALRERKTARQREIYEERNEDLASIPTVKREDVLTPQGSVIGVVQMDASTEPLPVPYLNEARAFLTRFEASDNRFVEHFLALRMSEHMGLDKDSVPLRTAIRHVMLERGVTDQLRFSTPLRPEELEAAGQKKPEPAPQPKVEPAPATKNVPPAPRSEREMLLAWLDVTTREVGTTGGCLLCSDYYPHMRGSCVCDATRQLLTKN